MVKKMSLFIKTGIKEIIIQDIDIKRKYYYYNNGHWALQLIIHTPKAEEICKDLNLSEIVEISGFDSYGRDLSGNYNIIKCSNDEINEKRVVANLQKI